MDIGAGLAGAPQAGAAHLRLKTLWAALSQPVVAFSHWGQWGASKLTEPTCARLREAGGVRRHGARQTAGHPGGITTHTMQFPIRAIAGQRLVEKPRGEVRRRRKRPVYAPTPAGYDLLQPTRLPRGL